MGLGNAYGNLGLKSGVCTSTTRPASPYEGMVIYETDTDLVLAWNGSSWATIGPTNTSGFQTTIQSGFSNVAASQTVTSSAWQDLGTIQSVTLTTGTKVLISVAAEFTRPSPETNFWTGCFVTGATTISASDDLSAHGYSYSQSNETLSRTWMLTVNAGSNTFTQKFRRDAANCNAYNRSLVVVAL